MQWVPKSEFAAEEVDHVDEVIKVSVASSPSFGQLHLVVDAFQ